MSASPLPHQPPASNTSESSTNPRNLAVFIDGTSNKPGDEDTNVVKLHRQVKKVNSESGGSGPEQRSLYLTGIGAYVDVNLSQLGRLRKSISNLPEMMFARNVKENVKDAYSWLVGNYREGGRIYLFGFSRGAYQVRSLANMIHEVGLVMNARDIDAAYDHYLSIDPYNDETRKNAIKFKKDFCWFGVRIHFVGVWDTVSSVGVIKEDVRITVSASVTNAHHFRHALALDERRVKFMPEYFTEVNAHSSRIRKPKSDVQEVWFVGSHSDVGGVSWKRYQSSIEFEDGVPYHDHAGNVSLLWMRREATAHGLVFEAEDFAWDPKDIDLGRKDSMSFGWRMLEILPFRHQLSFCGTGKLGWRWHLAHPRSVTPCQKIHSSVLSSDVYMPRAVLGDGVDIPTVPRKASGKVWTTELRDETTAQLLTSLLNDQQIALVSLEKVLFLLNYRQDNGHTDTIISTPHWLETMSPRSDLEKFALAVIRDLISPSSVPDTQLEEARNSISTLLSSRDHYFPEVFYILRFSTMHQSLRRRFIAHDNVVGALMLALEETPKCTDNSFQLATDSLCDLIKDESDDLRGIVIDHLRGTGAEQTRLLAMLKVKEPAHLIASLRMVACLAARQPDLCEGHLKSKIIELAKRRRGPVGTAAVAILVELEEAQTVIDATPVANIFGYLYNTLPQLDAEGGSTSSSDPSLPLVLQMNGSGELNEGVMNELLSAIKSRNARKRTTATLTLLKLSRNPIIRGFCLRDEVVRIFMNQLRQKEASLLAAYALRTYIKQGMEEPLDFARVAQSIVDMLTKGWFDGAVGQVEGFQIFRELMESSGLRQRVISSELVNTLLKMLEGGERHEVRMSSICLDIFASSIPTQLAHHVNTSIANLTSSDKKTRRKGVKVLSALAHTAAGEQAIEEQHLRRIVQMLSGPKLSSRSSDPIAALYNLAKNDTLREKIGKLDEFSALRSHPRRLGV